MNPAGRPSKARLYGLLTLMVFFWAANFVVAKVALRALPPLFVASTRTVISGVLILPLYFFEARKVEPHARWTGADVPELIGLGFLGVVMNQFLFVIGISRTSVAHAAIIMALVPILVLAIAAMGGYERLTRGKVAGMLVAVAGVVILQVGRSSANGPSPLGDLLIFLAGLTFAIFTVFSKGLATRHGTITTNTFAYVGGGLALLPLSLTQGSSHHVLSANLWSWTALLYMSIFPSVISYLIYSHALRYLPASRVSAFSYLQPLIAITLAAAFLSELPGAGFLTGGALVLSGVFMTARAR